MAKLIVASDYSVQAWMNDTDAYRSDPSVSVMRAEGATYSIVYRSFDPATNTVETADGPFNLADLLEDDTVREYRVIL